MDNNIFPVTPEPETKKIKRKSHYFQLYTLRILKSIDNQYGITSNARQQLNTALYIIATAFVAVINTLTEISGKKTISVKEIKNSCNILVTGELQKSAILLADNCIIKYNENLSGGKNHRAGVFFPPSLVEKFLRKGGKIITEESPIYFAAILEEITTKLLYAAIENAKKSNHLRLTVRDLELGKQNQGCIASLFDKCKLSFLGGGVKPFIHPSLLNKKPRKKKNEIKENELPIKNKKSRRYRPGTVSLREIRKYQKMGDCLILPKAPFEKLVRKIIKNKINTNTNINTQTSVGEGNGDENNIKISKKVFIILQYYLEQFAVDFLRDANSAAIHCNRVKLISADLLLISHLRKYPVLERGDITEKISAPIIVPELNKLTTHDLPTIEETIEEENENSSDIST